MEETDPLNPQNRGNPEIAWNPVDRSNSGDFGKKTGSDSAYHVQFSRHAMACPFEVLLHPNHPAHAPTVAVQALDAISQLEQKLSVYIAESEFSFANANAFSRPCKLSPSVIELLQLAISIHGTTLGAYDITAAALTQAWGFYRRQGRMPSKTEVEQALECSGTRYLQLHPETSEIRFLREGLQINPGGIGKGFALDRAAELLRAAGIQDFLVHGGQSSAIADGTQSGVEGLGWRIAVRHPYHSHIVLGELRLNGRGIGTSGAANQFFYFQGKRYGHVIDPRTGWPAQHWLSATAIADSAAVADAVSTAAFVMSPDELAHYAMNHPEIGLLAIRAGKREGETEILKYNVSEWVDVTQT